MDIKNDSPHVKCEQTNQNFYMEIPDYMAVKTEKNTSLEKVVTFWNFIYKSLKKVKRRTKLMITKLVKKNKRELEVLTLISKYVEKTKIEAGNTQKRPINEKRIKSIETKQRNLRSYRSQLVGASKTLLIVIIVTSLVGKAEGMKVATLNIGEAFENRWESIEGWMEVNSIDVLMMQETHITNKEFIGYKNKSKEYKLIGLHQTRAESVAAYMLKKALSLVKHIDIELEKAVKIPINENRAKNELGIITAIRRGLTPKMIEYDKKHRYIIVGLEVSPTETVFIINIYAPVTHKENEEFFRNLKDKVQEIKDKNENKNIRFIIGGDMNAKANCRLDKKIVNKNQFQFTAFKSFIKTHKLSDSYRYINGDKLMYTHSKSNKEISSIDDQETRIDYIFTDLRPEKILQSRIMEKNFALSKDHRAVVTTLKIEPERVNTKEQIEHEKKKKERVRYKTRNHNKEEIVKMLNGPKAKEKWRIKELMEESKNVNDHVEGYAKKKRMQRHYDNIVDNMNEVAGSIFGQAKSSTQRKTIEDDYKISRMRHDLEQMSKLVVKKGDSIKKNTYRINILKAYTKDNIDQKSATEIREATKNLISKLSNKIKVRKRKLKNKNIQNFTNKIHENYSSNPGKFFNSAKERKECTETEIKVTKVIYTDQQHEKLDILQRTIRENSKPDGKEFETESIYNIKRVIEEFAQYWQKIFDSRLHKSKISQTNPLTFIKEQIINIEVPFQTKWDSKLFGELFYKMKPFKAAGPNNLPGEMFIFAPEELRDIWESFMKYCWEENWIPEQWRQSYIVLLAKNALTEFLTYFRPIALAQTELKLYTGIIYEKLHKFCEENNLIEDLQFGYRKGMSAIQALITFKTVIDDAEMHEKDLFVMYLDFSKAYDSVEHDMIKRTLLHYKIPHTIIDIIMNLYDENTAHIFTPHGRTESIEIKNGVKQGDTLSPLLFTLFVNPLLTKLKNSNLGYKFHNNEQIHIPNIAYCDDITLIAESAEKMEKMAKIVMDFCDYTGMRLNPTKCIYTHKTKKGIDHSIIINNVEIKAEKWDKAQRLLGYKSELSTNQREQAEESIINLKRDLGRIKDRCYFTKQKIKLINLVFLAKISYRMNITKYNKKYIKEINYLCTEHVKESLKLPKGQQTKNERLWKECKDGGMGLYNAEALNQKTMLNTFLKQGINHTSKFPKETIMQQLKDKNTTVENIQDIADEGDLTYTASIANIINELPIEIVSKASLDTGKATIEINEGEYFEIKDAGKKKLRVTYTDGSKLKDGKAGAAVAYGNNNAKYWPVKYKSVPFSAELEALEIALATAKADVIFSDCKGAIDVIKKWETMNNKEKRQNKNRGILRSIENIVKTRKEKGLKEVEIIWIPSHIGEKNKKITETMKTQIQVLKNRFKRDFKKILKGNKIVDKLAQKGAERDEFVRCVPELADDYIVMIKGEFSENNICKYINEHHASLNVSDTNNLSKWGSLENFDIGVSNEILTKDNVEAMKLQEFVWRLRLNSLFVPAKQFGRYREQQMDNKAAINRSILYPTMECERCKGSNVCDIAHLWTCPAYDDIIKKMEEEIDQILRKAKHTEKIEKWYPNTKDGPYIDFNKDKINRNDSSVRSIKNKRKQATENSPTKNRRRNKTQQNINNEDTLKNGASLFTKNSEKNKTRRDYINILEKNDSQTSPRKKRKASMLQETPNNKRRKVDAIVVRQKDSSDKGIDNPLVISNTVSKGGKRKRSNDVQQGNLIRKKNKNNRNENLQDKTGGNKKGRSLFAMSNSETDRKKRKRQTSKDEARKGVGKMTKRRRITEYKERKNKTTERNVLTEMMDRQTEIYLARKKKRKEKGSRTRYTDITDILIEELKITSRKNVRVRTQALKTWTRSAITQYRKSKITLEEKYQELTRATQGYLPKRVVKEVKRLAKRNKINQKTVMNVLNDINVTVIKSSRKLYRTFLESNNRTRKNEGVKVNWLRGTKTGYKANRIAQKNVGRIEEIGVT